MRDLKTPEGRSLDAASSKVYRGLDSISRLNFMFAGIFLSWGIAAWSASIVGLAIPFYLAGSVEALLAGIFTLRPIMRRRLATFYSITILVPELAFFAVVIAQSHMPAAPAWGVIASAGVCGLLMNLNEAVRLAKLGAADTPLTRTMAPIMRAKAPYGLLMLIACLGTVATQTIWADLAVGFCFVAMHLRSYQLVDRISTLELLQTARDAPVVTALVSDYPPLAILVAPAWQEALTAVARRGQIIRNI